MTISDIVKNFKQMPWLLKLLFGSGVYSIITTLLAILKQTPLEFSYFGTGFPQNYPLLWHAYSLVISFLGLYVFVKRSYSLLVKFTTLSAVLTILAISNVFYGALQLSDQTERRVALLVYTVITVLLILLLVYPLQQKKYFNRK